MRKSRPENWRTLVLVGSLITCGIIGAAFALVGPKWGTFCLVMAMYEGWTLINAYREDTISEAIWILAKRPITVLLFGILVGWGAGSGYLGDSATVGRAFAIGLLYGHFFFTPVVTGSAEPSPAAEPAAPERKTA